MDTELQDMQAHRYADAQASQAYNRVYAAVMAARSNVRNHGELDRMADSAANDAADTAYSEGLVIAYSQLNVQVAA